MKKILQILMAMVFVIFSAHPSKTTIDSQHNPENLQAEAPAPKEQPETTKQQEENEITALEAESQEATEAIAVEDSETETQLVLDTTQPQITLQLPLFGKIILASSKDPATGVSVFTGRPAQETFNLGIMQIKNPTFQYDTESGLQLAGDISLKLPNLVEFSTKLSAQFSGKNFQEFTGSLDRPFAFKDNIVLQNVQILVKTSGYIELSGNVKISFMAGDIKIIDANVIGKIFISRNEGKTTVGFSGKLESEEPLKPFALIPGVNQIKDVRDISLSNINVDLDSTGELLLTGSCTVLGLTTSAKLIKTPSGITLKAWADGAFDVSKIIPGLKGSPMEKLDFSGLIFAISSTDYEDPDIKLTLPKGISFIIRSKLENGPLAGVAKLVGPQSLNIVGTFGTSLEDLALSVAAPAIIHIPDPTNPKKRLPH